MIAEGEVREQALAAAAANARARALQAQINPHFFFNTLTTVSALAELDGRAAKELVGRLAQLFRYTLSSSQRDMVTIEEELEFISNYLSIEQARFPRRLRFELPATTSPVRVLLPGLTLQPLVENAVRHGIARRREGGTVQVKLDFSDSTCCVAISNPLASDDGAQLLSGADALRPGHSLANVRDRLALVFEGRADLKMFINSDRWVTVVSIPVGTSTL
jgi:two-component system sensor histidine kinase AlgZ